MKVAIIINYWKNSPGGGGGIKTYIVNLTEELKKRENIDCKVIFRVGEDMENYKIGGSKFLFPIRAFLALRKIKPQIIHSQEVWFCLLAGVIYRMLYGVRLIHTFHTQSYEKLKFNKINNKIFQIIFQILLNKCNYITFVSKALKYKVEEFHGFKFKKIAITYAGIRSEEVSEESKKEFCEKFNLKNSIVLLAHGLTGIKYKAEGAKLLIKAVRKLRDKYPNITLILTREGLYSRELKEFAEKEKIDRNVIFTGNIDNPHVPLAICDIYTHITLVEGGLSMALLEAMSRGKPIIATKVGGILEAIENGKNGILVEPDVNEIVEKIEYLLENKEFAEKLGRNAKKTAEEKFTWNKSADRFMEIYKRLR